MNFSNTLNFMIRSGKGYRNISATSGITKLSDIIDFEVNELNNSDIFEFMENNYDEYDIKSLEYPKDIIDYTLSFIAKLFNTDVENLNGVWLTTHQDVLDIYCDNKFPECIDIKKIYIHENEMIPISDLGSDGALFVYIGSINIDSLDEEEES